MSESVLIWLARMPCLLQNLINWITLIIKTQLAETLTAKASWYSKTSMSDIFNPDRSKTLGVAYAGLNKRNWKTKLVKLFSRKQEIF